MSAENTAANKSTHIFFDPSSGTQLDRTGDKGRVNGLGAQASIIKMLVESMNSKAESDDPETSLRGYLSVLDEMGRLLRSYMDVFPKEQRNIEVVRNFLNAILLSKVYEQESYREILDQDRLDNIDDEKPSVLISRPG